VLRTAQHDVRAEMLALRQEAERTGPAACVASIGWEFMVTSQFICGTREIRPWGGLHAPAARPGTARYIHSLPAPASHRSYQRQVNVA